MSIYFFWCKLDHCISVIFLVTKQEMTAARSSYEPKKATKNEATASLLLKRLARMLWYEQLFLNWMAFAS